MPGSEAARLRAPLETVMREAGELARVTARRPFKRWTKGDDDSPVSEGDIAVNDLLQARLAANCCRGAGWLSEETRRPPRTRRWQRVWIVDPIDGTRAYIAGRADWTISVALVENGRPLLAALYAPVTDEMFLAAARRKAPRSTERRIRGERRRRLSPARSSPAPSATSTARRARAGHLRRAQGILAGAAARPRRAGRARRRLRLRRQPRLGPCGGRPFGARSRRRDDRLCRPGAAAIISRMGCMAR